MFSRTQKYGLLLALLVTCVGLVLWIDPIPQPVEYHRFSDTRQWLGIPNFLDVVSNAGFLVVGVIALVTIFRNKRSLFVSPEHARPYLVYFGAVTLVAFGSAYYHWAPSNSSLLWDRLPISMAFMAISAAVVADRIDARAGNGWLLIVLLLTGLASLFYWYWSESIGRGDLRFYALVQFFPIIALPVIVRAFPVQNYILGRYLVWIILWYALSKLLEHLDSEVFELTGNLVSGHSLKHLAAAMATWMVFRMLCATKSRSENIK